MYLGSNKTGTGAVTLGDRSYTGKNQITFENTSIKSVSSDKVMFANQTLDSPSGMSDTTITFKGNNFLYQDGAKASGPERDAIHFYKNEMTAGLKEKANIPSHTKIVSEKGSTLNMYVKSGSVKARGIGVTQYKDQATPADKKLIINQTEMEFRGAVNIKIERGPNNQAELYGVFGSNTTKRMGGIGEPPGSYNKINFYSDVKIDTPPVLDENGKQLAIGDAINMDGKDSHVGIYGNGKVQIDGDIHVLNGATVDLNLHNKDSYINGEIHIGKLKYGGDPDELGYTPSGQGLFNENRDDKDPEKNATKLTLNMSNGARWNATNTSKINDLAIDNEAEITFGSDKRYINISTGTLKGNGTFHMSGDIVANKSDKLIIRKSSEGHHKITYKDDGTAKTKGNESLLLVEYKTDNKDDIKGYFSLKNGTTDQGAYEYVLTLPEYSKIAEIPPRAKLLFESDRPFVLRRTKFGIVKRSYLPIQSDFDGESASTLGRGAF
ncbi:TPA: pertactin-like passenger domain-containing protein [Neisseria lactamica]